MFSDRFTGSDPHSSGIINIGNTRNQGERKKVSFNERVHEYDGEGDEDEGITSPERDEDELNTSEEEREDRYADRIREVSQSPSRGSNGE